MSFASFIQSQVADAPGTSRHRDGRRLMIAGGLLLGTIGVFFVEAGADPITAVWFRCLFGALTLIVWAGLTGRLQDLRLPRDGAVAALGSGVLMLLNWMLFFEAVSRTSIGVATVVFHVQPFWVMALAACCCGERITRRQLLAVGGALLGLVLATGALDQVSAATMLEGRYLVGIAICLAASLSYAGVTLIAKSARTVTPLALSFWQCAVGGVVLAAWPLWHGLSADGVGWGWLVGLGVLHTGLAYVLLYAGMARLAAGQIALLQFVYPVTALLVDAWVYDHRLGPLQGVGIALLGIALWGARRG